jgi:hypothetical protein
MVVLSLGGELCVNPKSKIRLKNDKEYGILKRYLA